MILDWTGTELELREADNFRAFKLVAAGDPDPLPEIEGIRFVDRDNVLVDPDLPPRLPGAPDSGEWRAGYSGMLEAAARFGWIDAETGAVKAHVEWAAS